MDDVEGACTFQHGLNINVPTPEKFKESRVANDVDNFLFSIKDYFQAMGVKDDMCKLSMIPSYLKDMAFFGNVQRGTTELVNRFELGKTSL